jgi:endo-1,4-beta-D-glucanase Y
VKRSSFDNYDTVSEGIAYGMLFAAYANDKTTFDGLWAYAQKHVNSNGVMNWRIDASGNTTGWNGATDADEDIAAALIAADITWGGYKAAATKQINTVRQHQIEVNSYVVKPGDVWGGSAQLNPSYIAPSYYELFKTYTGDASWGQIKEKGYEVLSASQNDATGLVPDWSTSTGTAVNGMGYHYGYDASRAPLRIAMSAAWTCDQAALDLLKPFNTWSAKQNLDTLASSYTLAGTPVDRGDAAPLLAAAAAGAITSSNTQYKKNVWEALVKTPSTSYYPDSMKVFGLFVASGLLKSPLELSAQQPVPPYPTSFAITGDDRSTTTNTTVDVTLSFSAPSQNKNLLTDIEIYDNAGNKVAQQVWEQQTLTTAPSLYTIRWTPTAKGEYTVKAGIFTSDWSKNLSWNNSAATITVEAPLVVVPVTPPVIEPIPTPTPDPIPAPPVIPVVVPVTPQPTLPVVPIASNVSIWWPGSTQAVSGEQPFKAVLDGYDLNQYQMYWQVDNGGLNLMSSVHGTAAHKISMVDLQYWTWSQSGRYTINFVAKKLDGTVIAQKSTIITVVR